jgi:hypothetical protein
MLYRLEEELFREAEITRSTHFLAGLFFLKPKHKRLLFSPNLGGDVVINEMEEVIKR